MSEQRELTAMQEWLKWFEENRFEIILNIDVAKDKAIELLPKEKSQIVDAYNFAATKSDPLFDPEYEYAEDYYSLTYMGEL